MTVGLIVASVALVMLLAGVIMKTIVAQNKTDEDMKRLTSFVSEPEVYTGFSTVSIFCAG